ncbi:MAG: hypothetical protein ACYCVB_09570 [Bacilli bacterium]
MSMPVGSPPKRATLRQRVFRALSGEYFWRARMRGKNAITMIFLASNLLPTVALIIPFYVLTVTYLSGQYLHLNNEIAAGGVLSAIPPVLIVLFIGKYIVSGLTAGSVKG